MLYFQYPPADYDHPSYGMRLERLDGSIRTNIRKATQYFNRTETVYPNTHFLQRLLSVLSNYRGSSEQETYTNVEINTRQICLLLDITNEVNAGGTHEILGTEDIVVVNRHYPRYDPERLKMDEDGAFDILTHNWTDNNPHNYKEVQPGTAVFGINLPLLAAQHHKESRRDEPLTDNGFLTQIFSGWIGTILYHAAFNSVQAWCSGEGSKYTSMRAPYSLVDVPKFGLEAAQDIRDHFKYYTHKSVGNLVDQLFLGWVDRNNCVPDLKDFYLENMQWVGMYLDKQYFKRIELLDDTFGLELDLEGVRRSSRRMVSSSKLNNLLRVVPDTIKEHVKETYF